MDGLYEQKKDEYMGVLRAWLYKVIVNKQWEKYVDLPVNTIHQDFKQKSSWLDGSIFIFDCILSLLDKSKYDVFLIIPLSSNTKPYRGEFKTLDDIKPEIGLSTPSFLLFPKGEKNFQDSLRPTRYLNGISEITNFKVYYKEVGDGKVFYRTLYFRSNISLYLRVN